MTTDKAARILALVLFFTGGMSCGAVLYSLLHTHPNPLEFERIEVTKLYPTDGDHEPVEMALEFALKEYGGKIGVRGAPILRVTSAFKTEEMLPGLKLGYWAVQVKGDSPSGGSECRLYECDDLPLLADKAAQELVATLYKNAVAKRK